MGHQHPPAHFPHPDKSDGREPTHSFPIWRTRTSAALTCPRPTGQRIIRRLRPQRTFCRNRTTAGAENDYYFIFPVLHEMGIAAFSQDHRLADQCLGEVSEYSHSKLKCEFVGHFVSSEWRLSQNTGALPRHPVFYRESVCFPIPTHSLMGAIPVLTCISGKGEKVIDRLDSESGDFSLLCRCFALSLCPPNRPFGAIITSNSGADPSMSSIAFSPSPICAKIVRPTSARCSPPAKQVPLAHLIDRHSPPIISSAAAGSSLLTQPSTHTKAAAESGDCCCIRQHGKDTHRSGRRITNELTAPLYDPAPNSNSELFRTANFPRQESANNPREQADAPRMWFEDRSLSNMKVSSLIVEEWRDIWSAKPEFMFAALAYLFATTNLLNLPRLVLDHGGPAFLVAYGAALLGVVLPILVLEVCIGQLTGRGPVQAFYNICPVFKGVGIAQILFSLFVMATMTRYLAMIFMFIYHLFWTLTDDRPGLPWLHCKNFPEFQFGACRESASVFSQNSSAFTVRERLATFHDDSAMSQFLSVVDNQSESIAQVGQFQLHLLIAQCLVWALVFCAICFGVRWLGKVIVFTFLVPVALLLGLCGRAIFASGAIEMFEQFFVETLDWEKLKDYLVWKAAIEQAILATGLGFGAFITIGSYNKRSNNLVKDSFVLVVGHALVGTLQLATVVALVGHASLKTGLSPAELIDQGENQFYQLLVYLAHLPHAKILSGMFLVMSGCVLLNIFFLLALSVLATLEDAFGEKWSRCCPRFTLALFVCLVGAASALFFATQAGKHGYELTSGYLQYVTLACILAFELVTVSWVYCAHSLGMDLKTMLSSSCCWCLGHFLLFLTYLLPVVPIAIAVLNVLGYSYADKYSAQIRAWRWSEWCGVAIALAPLVPIPLWAMLAICRGCMRGARISPCRRLCLAFRSPMRYELMKGSMSSGAHHRVDNQQQHYSPRFSGGPAPAAGYLLLPQAPLAQPEVDDILPGSAGARRHQIVNENNTSSSTLRADSSSNERTAERVYL